MTVKELRSLTGLSQSDFAKKFNIKTATLQMWEQGVNNTPAHVLFMISRILELEGYPVNEGN